MKLNMQIRPMFLLGFAVIGQGVTLAAACTREAEAPAATPSASDTANQTDAIPAETADALPYQPKAVPTVGPGGTYAERCQKIAAALCGHLENCCFSAVPGCEADLLDECLDPGKFDGLAAAASAGKLVLDPVLAAQCDVAIAAVGATCSKTAMMTVLVPCLFAWTDPAALGQACQDGWGEVCAGGQGRCGPMTLPTCITATAVGEACPKGAGACVWDSFCGWPEQKQVCVQSGSFCGLFGDVEVSCPNGKVCVAGACAVDTGAAMGQACSQAPDCRGDNDCVAGKCASKLCKNLPGD